ncbi:DUF1499 domain-containing protein [Desulfopila sp. IMCC35008]|uniref:DUF1499 domain-containing protein n=1 Tax=Desulfopila sp. IMCC35008 TaxID=2653858 RepID=UPI0013D26E97|nr:DUF1499 domain-containing protein [Desulfopila sp. IMCC35008]
MNRQTHLALLFVITLTGCSGTKPELGVNDGQLNPCPKTPNCVNSQATDEKHSIPPLHYTGNREEARLRLLHILKSAKRASIMISEQEYIRVQFTSALFRFADDTEFYFQEDQDRNKVIHVRSASRIGYSDFGTNRQRVEKIRKKFQNPPDEE